MQNNNNPLMMPYGTPHDAAPFGKITIQDFEEAMLEGIRRDDEQIGIICSDPAEPTFDNTIVRVDDDTDNEHYYDLLDRTTTIFFNLMSAETSDEMDALAQKMSPILTRHANDVRLNKVLFERIRKVHDGYASPGNDGRLRPLTEEEKTLLDKCYDGFVRSGALLDEAGKEKLRRISEEASMLSLQFSQNLLKENKAFKLVITDEKELEGLPQTAIDAAATAWNEERRMKNEESEGNEDSEGTQAKAPQKGWLFTLDYPSYSPFMTYSTQRELRRQMYMARNTVCIHDNDCNNLEICRRLVNLRRELAQLLGYRTYADYVLKYRMASTVTNVYRLLDDLIEAYKPAAEREREELLAMARRIEGEDFRMEPWDTGYYSHKLQLERFNIDAEMLRPYFRLEYVIKGVFGLATRLYGITFRENKDIPVYHPDVKAYEVFDRDGSYLAVFYADFHPRKGKQGGAWMTEYQGQWIDTEDQTWKQQDGKWTLDKGKEENVRPHVSVVMNLTKPADGKPALLTLGEVETFLHEFGHSLHGMFANTRFESLSGTNVWWDFVELPSQFMENFSTEREFLRTFAFHYETGEVIPDELIDRIIASRNFGVAGGCLGQVRYGLLDMAYYTREDEFTDDIIPFEKKAWAKAILGKQRDDTCMTVQFSHIMAGGYAAGYYSYKWAEVLDADAFAVFRREGIFNPETAQRFRDCILSKGGTEHPMTLYNRFKGSEPTIDALLERNGIRSSVNN